MCVGAAAFAADVKINDTAFPAKGNTFTRSWSFLTHVSAAKELKLAAEDFAQHPKLKGIAGVTKPVVVKISAPSKITDIAVTAEFCNFLDRAKRDYVIEISADNKEWSKLAEANGAGGITKVKFDNAAAVANDGTVYLRFSKALKPADRANKIPWSVMLKKVTFSIKF